MVTIRKFTHEDAEAIRQAIYPDMTSAEISEMIDQWNACVYRDRAFESFAIVSDERIVGYASLYEHSRSVASAGVELIAEERRKGAASEALSLLLRYASEKRYRIILDQVRTDNTASIRLHEKLRFESDGYVYRTQRGQDIVLYLKAI